MLRKTQPDVERPIRIRGTIGWVAVLPVLALVVVFAVSGQLEARATGLAAVLTVGGVLVHWIHRFVEAKRRRPL